jgi:hypothetical protein
MNYLQRYIDVRGINCQDIATATGFGYHSIQKNVKGIRRNHNIRTAIAEYLGLDPEKTWSRGAVVYLRKMVAVAVNQMADEKAQKARREFLEKYSDDATLTAKGKAVNV